MKRLLRRLNNTLSQQGAYSQKLEEERQNHELALKAAREEEKRLAQVSSWKIYCSQVMNINVESTKRYWNTKSEY